VIERLTSDSRRASPGAAFFAWPGAGADGRRFIPQAIERGCAAVVWESGGFAWDARWQAPNAPVADLKSQVYYDVRTAFLDLTASREQMETATRARELATQQLEQSRDRFAAGVASNIEVVQAQEAVALAADQYISAVYGVNIAKALLAQSVGTAEDAVRRYFGGPTP